jgi:hypothetical protein
MKKIMTTPFKFVTLSTGQIVRNNWVPERWRPDSVLNETYINNEDTFVVICGPDQTRVLNFLKKCPELNVLFVSKPAINRSPNHNTGPRNTVVVFEKK